MTLTVGSLFSGIGGIDLGLERAGMTVTWQSEINPFASRVLARHWPDVPNLGDVTTINWEDVPRVDVICGGFPCQDISHAGRLAGIDGERSGLWAHYARAVRVLRPRFVLVENVADLLVRGLGRVVADLAESGYRCQWDCIPAAAVGAPHGRDRLFLVADADLGRGGGGGDERRDGGALLPQGVERIFRRSPGCQDWGPRPDRAGLRGVDDGVPDRVDRLRALGNAVVPQVAEHIGRRLVAYAESLQVQSCAR